MLLIVGIVAKGEGLPMESLQQVDSALAAAGFRKEIRSVIKPGKEFTTTYDGPNIDRSRVDEALKPLAERNQFTFTVEIEEAVRFP